MITANNKWTLTELLPDSQAGTAYYWVIRPCKTSGYCAPEPTKATNAFDKRSNPITGLAEHEHESTDPAPGARSGWLERRARVRRRDRALMGRLPGDQPGGQRHGRHRPACNPRGQELQRADRHRPELPVGRVDAKVTGIDQTSFTPYTQTLPEGPLYWRVQAVDASNNPLAWSLSRDIADASKAIEKVSPTAQLLSPSYDAKVSETPALTWGALELRREVRGAVREER